MHNGDGTTTRARGKVSYNMNQYNHGGNKVIDLLYSTKNPLTPRWLTPSVDVNTRLVLNHNPSKQTLNVGFTVKADGYPSTEAFIEDPSGNRLFLGAAKESGRPQDWLFGGPNLLQFSGNMSINLDASGNFLNIQMQPGMTMSIENWNSIVQGGF